MDIFLQGLASVLFFISLPMMIIGFALLMIMWIITSPLGFIGGIFFPLFGIFDFFYHVIEETEKFEIGGILFAIGVWAMIISNVIHPTIWNFS